MCLPFFLSHAIPHPKSVRELCNSANPGIAEKPKAATGKDLGLGKATLAPAPVYSQGQ
jgi:hypothetical protein